MVHLLRCGTSATSFPNNSLLVCTITLNQNSLTLNVYVICPLHLQLSLISRPSLKKHCAGVIIIVFLFNMSIVTSLI